MAHGVIWAARVWATKIDALVTSLLKQTEEVRVERLGVPSLELVARLARLYSRAIERLEACCRPGPTSHSRTHEEPAVQQRED